MRAEQAPSVPTTQKSKLVGEGTDGEGGRLVAPRLQATWPSALEATRRGARTGVGYQRGTRGCPSL